MNKILYLAVILLSPMYSFAALDNFIEIPITSGMSAYPSVDVNLSYNDNIFLADEQQTTSNNGNVLVDPVKSSFITEISPGLILKGRNGLHKWSIGYKGEFGWYHDSSHDNYSDHRFTSTLQLVANSRNQIDLGFDLLYLHEGRGSGISDGAASGQTSISIEPDSYRDGILRAGYTFGSETSKGKIIVDGQFLDRTYVNNRDRTKKYDRQDSEIGGTFYYRISPRTSLVFLGKLKDISYAITDFDNKGTLDSTEQRYEAGISWQTTAKTIGTATIGQTYKDFSSTLRKDNHFTSWEVSTIWSPKTYSHLKLLANSTPTETTNSGDFVKSNTFAANWQHEWSIKIGSYLAASYNSEIYEGSDRDDKIYHYQAGINFKPKRGINFDLSYQNAHRNSNSNGFDYKNNQILLTTRLGL